jgi:hypothetical protein
LPDPHLLTASRFHQEESTVRTTSFITLAATVPFLILVLMQGRPPDAVQQLIALSEEARQAALNGDATWQERHLAEGFTAIEPNGEMKSRAEAIKMRKAGLVKFDSIEVVDRKVRVYGDTALVITRANLKAHIGARDISGGSWLSAVWVKERGSWKEVASQSTSVSTNQ